MDEADDAVESALTWAKLSDCARFGIAPTTEGWTRAWIRRQLERIDLASSVLLDLGSGGHSPLTAWYCGRARHAFLIDLHDPPARFPRATSLVHDLEWPLPIPSESVDIVISASAFQFLTPAGRRLQMAEIQRVLRPGGIALLTMVWLFPLTPGALLTLANEPFMEQRKIRFFGAPDIADMLKHGGNLRVDGDFVPTNFPGFEDFSLQTIPDDPQLLVTGLTDFDPSAFRPETVALGIQRLAMGMRLKKEPAQHSLARTELLPDSRESRGNPRELIRTIESGRMVSGSRILIVEREGPDELVTELARQGAKVEHLRIDDRFWKCTGVYDYVIARNCLSRQRNPAKFLRALAETGAQIWIDDTLVDSGKYECAYIPPGDVVEHPQLPGKMRISLSWLFRELMRMDFDPVLLHPPELFAGNGQILQSPKRMLISAARRRRACDYPPLLVHVHLPKNAGSSFNDLLLSSFGRQFVPMYLKDPRQRFDELSFSHALRAQPIARAVASHSFGVFPPVIAGYRPLYVAFLREPLARQYSYYRFGRTRFDELSKEHVGVLPPDFQLMSIQEFLRFETTLAENHVLNSSQAFFLTGGDDAQPAIDVLSQFFFVGVVEQMELSMTLLRAKLQQIGLPLDPGPLKRVNTATAPEDNVSYGETPEARELLKHLEPDLQLYEWGCKHLEAEARSLQMPLPVAHNR
jgi:SAM-dependent methyltransferase